MKIYTNPIDINYNQESISLPVIHNGVDLEWIPELKDYLQDTFDELPQYFKQAYHPVSHQVLMRRNGYTTHITTFNLIELNKLVSLQEVDKNQIIELIYDPEFSGPILPKILQTYDSVIIINYGG